jgi:hypothetical protein
MTATQRVPAPPQHPQGSHDEIARVRFERVRQFLRETPLTLAEIAERSGFRTAEYLAMAFRCGCACIKPRSSSTWTIRSIFRLEKRTASSSLGRMVKAKTAADAHCDRKRHFLYSRRYLQWARIILDRGIMAKLENPETVATLLLNQAVSLDASRQLIAELAARLPSDERERLKVVIESMDRAIVEMVKIAQPHVSDRNSYAQHLAQLLNTSARRRK